MLCICVEFVLQLSTEKMDKCRICLKQRKRMRSVFEKEHGDKIVNMITSIANVKILNNDGFTDKICSSCCKKLREAYEFKVSIERSDYILHESTNMKRISFNNIHDINIINIEFNTDCKPVIPATDFFFVELFKSSDNCLTYNDIFIKKVKTKYNDNQEVEPWPALGRAHLSNVRAEPDDDFENDIALDDYDTHGAATDSDIELNEIKNKQNGKKLHNKIKRVVQRPAGEARGAARALGAPVKPVYLKDVRIMPTAYKRRRRKKKQHPVHSNICPYCGKILKKLDQHILIHIGERTFKCDICSKAFFHGASLKSHKRKHVEAGRHRCGRCVAIFTTKCALSSHQLTHTDEKNHICDVCSKAFKRLSALKRHALIHNFANKRFRCDACSMSFLSKYGLRHHRRVHSGERPYRCEICSQPYSYKHDFNRHCFKKHGVFLKRRSVYVMNDEVLKRERATMADLARRVHGILKEGEPLNPFEGPQAALAFEQAIKAIESKQIPIGHNI